MNGTVIDIPGLNVSVNPISLEDSTDMAHVIKIEDEQGNSVVVSVAFGKINNLESNVKMNVNISRIIGYELKSDALTPQQKMNDLIKEWNGFVGLPDTPENSRWRTSIIKEFHVLRRDFPDLEVRNVAVYESYPNNINQFVL